MRIALCALLVAAACGKGTQDKDGAAKVEPFKGPLTVEKVLSAKGKVQPFDPWGPAFAKLQAGWGPPTKSDGKKHYWAAMEGDDCAYFYVEEEDGAKFNRKGQMVGAVMDAEKYGKDSAIGNRAECLGILGKDGPAEDPNIEAPRADGAAYEVSQVTKLAVPGRRTWTDKQIRVTGHVTQMMGDEALLKDRVDDSISLSCKMDAGASQPPMKGTIVMQGTVHTRKFVTGAGEPGIDAYLDKCTVVALDCKAKVVEMHSYFDLLKASGPKGPKPWPTGDDKADEAIRTYIAELNKKLAKAKAADLLKGIKDTTLPLIAKCKPAVARYNEILKSTDADRLALIQSVGDKFAECDCQVDMEMWLARQYMALMAASGATLDKPLTY